MSDNAERIDSILTELDAAQIAHERSAGAAPLDVRSEVQHALDALNSASDKMTYGDSVEGDLLEAHATLDSLLAALSEGTDR